MRQLLKPGWSDQDEQKFYATVAALRTIMVLEPRPAESGRRQADPSEL
jgi:hypothetical protein